jgi:hypothetical protein
MGLWGAACLIGLATLNPGQTTQGIVLVVIGVLFVIVFGYRPGLWVTSGGVRVRNLITAFELSWSEIREFRIGRHKIPPTVCVIDLEDGSSRYVAAVQLSSWSLRNSAAAPERKVIEELNAKLASNRRTTV